MTNRQFKLVLTLALLAGIVGGAMGSWVMSGSMAFAGDNRKVVVAQEFRVVDEQGAMHARFYTEGGQTQLTFSEGEGEMCLSLGVCKDQRPSLALWGPGGTAQVQLGIGNGRPYLSLHNPEFTNHVRLGVYDGAPTVDIYVDRRLRERLGLVGERIALILWDEAGKRVYEGP